MIFGVRKVRVEVFGLGETRTIFSIGFAAVVASSVLVPVQEQEV